MKPASGYFTSVQAAAYLGMPSRAAFYMFCMRLRQKGTPLRTYRVGGRLRFRQVDLDRLIEPVRVSA